MLRLRLRRTGKKKQPSYRIVVAEARTPRDGRFIEQVGTYNPLTDPPMVVLQQERISYWLRHGAQASDVVGRLLGAKGIGT